MRWQRPEDEKLIQRLDDESEEDEEEDEEGEEETGSGGEEEDKLQEKMLKTRTILVSEAISDELAKKVYQHLLVLEGESREKPITVIVNSPGGEADSGFGMYDMLRFVEMPVRTIVAGLCASAAVMVFLGGDDGKRFSTPNSRFLLHQPSSQSFGQASDLLIASDEIIRLRKQYNQIVAHIVGKDLAAVTKDADRDFWLTSQQAVDYGLVTKIIANRKDLPEL
jgi:ATP-dependent Clp protease, protease subunit